MPARKHTPDFTACTQFGIRYSSLGKRVAASDPYREGENPREVTSTMNLYELCEALDIELTEEQAEKEAEYIYENRRQYYTNHPYMEKRAIAKCYDGPVFPDDVVYRRSNCEKYTVLPDGSIENASGRDKVKQPNWEGFVHTAPKKHEKVATFTKGMPRKTNDKSPAITLPKQDNPLVKGEYKTRTPEEESKAKAREREAIRKEVAKTTEEEKEIVFDHYEKEMGEGINPLFNYPDQAIIDEFRNRNKWYRRGSGETPASLNWKASAIMAMKDFSDLELAKEMESRDGLFHRLIPAALRGTTDADLVEELRRRGYEVTATKTINL